jgi:glycosyltransferase involved in cell wall biosynthesis
MPPLGLETVRLVHCAETIKGGIATYLNDLLPLQRASFGSGAVLVVIPRSQASELKVPDGVGVVLYTDTLSRTRNAIELAWIVVKLYRRYRPAIVHVHSTFAGVAVRSALAAAACSAKVIYCAHGWAWERPMALWARCATMAVERILARWTSAIICISEYERCAAIGAGIRADRLRLICNGVSKAAPEPLESPIQWPEGVLRVLFVGRFDRQKGVDLLLDALRQIGPEVYAILAGGTVLGDSEPFHLPPNARAIGWVTQGQLQSLFAASHVLVVPSRWEGFGLIAAEAMRTGLPVIATRVGGLPEIVVSGETGILIAPESPTALVAALKQIDRDDLKRMGNAARKRFQSLFTMDRVHRELCEIYGMVG